MKNNVIINNNKSLRHPHPDDLGEILILIPLRPVVLLVIVPPLRLIQLRDLHAELLIFTTTNQKVTTVATVTLFAGCPIPCPIPRSRPILRAPA